jgi:hypothetical protein
VSGGSVEIVLNRVPLFDGYGSLRTFPETGAEAIAICFANQSGFAVYDSQRAFVTGRDAVAAPIALFFVYPNNISHGHA